ncbi:MAG: hypothetical protein II795_00030 [Firmicutes bacterium]|nr:hypothetical protein [Bacillota bacterium]
MDKLKKLFGGINLTWPKLIIFAVIAGVYTAVMALIPALEYTSFNTITVTFEVWVLFGILIIMNSKSNLDSALKCFVFFLISQPLVYLIQVPFSHLGWSIFGYYKYWFIWTILCLPMGFIGYYMKKDKWWGYLILLPMIVLVADSYGTYLSRFIFSYPYYILIVLFCAVTMILYPLVIFNNRKIRLTGVIVSCVLIIGLTVYSFLKPPVYSTDIMGSNAEHYFDDTYSVYLEDDKYGEVRIIPFPGDDGYLLHAEFKHAGRTALTIEAPDGQKTEYDLLIERDYYEVNRK